MPSPLLADSNILLRVAQTSHVHHAIGLAALDKLLTQNFDRCIVTWMKCGIAQYFLSAGWRGRSR